MTGAKHKPNDIYIQDDTAYMVLTSRAGFPVAVTMIDAADVSLIRAFPHRWNAMWRPAIQNYYATASIYHRDGKQQTIKLHRFLLQPLAGMDTDHINHNSLDNRRANLRAVTRQQNALNYRPGAYDSLRGADGQTGWSIEQIHNRWRLRHREAGKYKQVGTFATREEAEAARERMVA